ncbi:VC2046/SO_2500 family protein [Paraferrimonas sp. SM1919]|uniref:VC2046/SO_2500 family protein n=1 Tax=Paraferrimonas sp. SM1919 TaxID=2662263 RepID=UPI0013D8663A|nr:VC2046/SO_2500 family protein [Paraferrimonas sp. SM1919]
MQVSSLHHITANQELQLSIAVNGAARSQFSLLLAMQFGDQPNNHIQQQPQVDVEQALRQQFELPQAQPLKKTYHQASIAERDPVFHQGGLISQRLQDALVAPTIHFDSEPDHGMQLALSNYRPPAAIKDGIEQYDFCELVNKQRVFSEILATV